MAFDLGVFAFFIATLLLGTLICLITLFYNITLYALHKRR